MSFMIQSVIQLCVLETTVLFHAAGHDFTHEMVTEFQRWPGFPSHTSLSFVTINIGGDAPIIIIQTHLTQTETQARRSDHIIIKQNKQSIKMWWIETENYDIVILGQL